MSKSITGPASPHRTIVTRGWVVIDSLTGDVLAGASSRDQAVAAAKAHAPPRRTPTSLIVYWYADACGGHWRLVATDAEGIIADAPIDTTGGLDAAIRTATAELGLPLEPTHFARDYHCDRRGYACWQAR